MRLAVSAGGPGVYQTHAPCDEALVGTMNGVAVIKRTEPGAWEVTHLGLEGQHADALVVEPRTGTIFAGTFGDAVHASEDGGRTWQRRSNGIEQPQIFSINLTQVGDVIHLYCGTEPAHLYRSTDVSRSWQELRGLRSASGVETWGFPAPPHDAHVKYITFDPRNAATIYVGIEVGGVYRTLDGGATWARLGEFAENSDWDQDFHRLAFRPSDPQHIFMTGGSGIYRSANGGQQWEQLTSRAWKIGYPDVLIAHPEREGLVFVGGAFSSPNMWRKVGTADCHLARSRDGGDTWQVMEGGLPSEIVGNIEAMSMNVWPGGCALFAAGIDGDVFYSDDEGDNWSIIASGLPPVSKGTREERHKLRKDAPERVSTR